MVYVLRYFVFISIFSLGLIVFNLYVNLHVYSQLFYNLLYKEFDEIHKNYDYIIVGSGTAGSIMAYRLAQQSSNKILLLEAGPYSNFLFDIPALTPMLQKTDLDWQYETVPQKHACRAFKNNVSSWPMGKIFGGTHRFNNMIHVRSHRQDFDEWFENLTDYSYEKDVLYYFKKAENWMGTQDSLLHINNLNFESALSEAILDAAEFLGYPVNNMNNDPGLGFMKPFITTRQNRRWTTSHSLLERPFKNLKIITNAHVNKIIFKNNYEASGVQFNFLGDKKIIRAKKGVILSAGVIGSPKILLLSGIGPQKHLSSVKIRPRKNLPVGENLQDHITTGLDLIILNKTLSINIESLVSPLSAFKYFFKAHGPWISVGCEAIGFCHTLNNTLDSQPNLEFMILPAGVSSDSGKHLKNIIGLQPQIWTDYFSKLIGQQVVSILPIILHPKSRGTVRLKSTDPNLSPEINPNYLSNHRDLEILLEGIKVIKKLLKTPSMQKLGARLNPTPFLGCRGHKFNSKNYWECYIRHLTLSSFHPIGTCKLGDPNNKNTVVDYNFKVIRMNKLYVVDGSVLPTLPSGNPNSAIAMLAERAADMIKYLQFLTEGSCRKIQIFVHDKMCYK